MKGKIKVVLWDIDGTLLNFDIAEHNAITSCFSSFKLGPITDEMICEYSKINTSYWEKLERGEMKKSDILVCRFRDFLKKYNLDYSIAEDFNREFQTRLADTVEFYPHALETVKSLKENGIIQCAVTNGTLRVQNRKLKVSTLDQILDFVFISENIGIEKPQKGFFDVVFSALGNVAKDQIMIVGDSLTSDMKGGLDANIKTCFFNPQGTVIDRNLNLDYVITDLAKVKEIVGIV